MTEPAPTRGLRPTPLATTVVDAIEADPRYRDLVATRSRWRWSLTLLMTATFVGYLGLIAFNKAFLARPIGNGVTTLGVPIGFGIILLAIAITASYVVRANRHFDPLVAAVRRDLLTPDERSSRFA